MQWIEYHPYDDIPKELYYPGCELDKDKDGRTPLMMWIEYRFYDNEDEEECEKN